MPYRTRDPDYDLQGQYDDPLGAYRDRAMLLREREIDDYDRRVSDYGRESATLAGLNPDFDRLSPQFGHVRAEYDRRRPVVGRLEADYDRLQPGYAELDARGRIEYERERLLYESERLARKIADYERERPGFERELPEFEREVPDFDRRRPELDRRRPELDRRRLELERMRPELDRVRPDYDREMLDFDRRRPDFDDERPVLERKRLLLERRRSDLVLEQPDFDRERLELDRAKPVRPPFGIERPIFDRKSSEFGRKSPNSAVVLDYGHDDGRGRRGADSRLPAPVRDRTRVEAKPSSEPTRGRGVTRGRGRGRPSSSLPVASKAALPPKDKQKASEERKQKPEVVQEEKVETPPDDPKEDDDDDYYCFICERGYKEMQKLKLHMNTHIECGIEGCRFKACASVVSFHKQTVHEAGYWDILSKLKTPEEIEDWREERKKNHPSAKKEKPLAYNDYQFFCDPCDMCFKLKKEHEAHCAGHVLCARGGCLFRGHPSVLQLHHELHHQQGYAVRVARLRTPRDIAVWREQRRRNYPKLDKISKQQAEKYVDKPVEKKGEKPVEKKGEKPGEKKGAKPVEKKGAKPGEKKGEKKDEKPDEKPGEKKDEEPSEKVLQILDNSPALKLLDPKVQKMMTKKMKKEISSPWVDDKLLSEISKKYELMELSKVVRTPEMADKFNKQCNLVAKLLMEAKRLYEDQANAQKFYCDTCNTGYYYNEDLWGKHTSLHVACSVDKCKFMGMAIVNKLHVKWVHEPGYWEKISSLKTSRDIRNWKKDRKTNFPTLAKITKIRAEEEKIAAEEKKKAADEAKDTAECSKGEQEADSTTSDASKEEGSSDVAIVAPTDSKDGQATANKVEAVSAGTEGTTKEQDVEIIGVKGGKETSPPIYKKPLPKKPALSKEAARKRLLSFMLSSGKVLADLKTEAAKTAANEAKQQKNSSEQDEKDKENKDSLKQVEAPKQDGSVIILSEGKKESHPPSRDEKGKARRTSPKRSEDNKRKRSPSRKETDKQKKEPAGKQKKDPTDKQKKEPANKTGDKKRKGSPKRDESSKRLKKDSPDRTRKRSISPKNANNTTLSRRRSRSPLRRSPLRRSPLRRSPLRRRRSRSRSPLLRRRSRSPITRRRSRSPSGKQSESKAVHQYLSQLTGTRNSELLAQHYQGWGVSSVSADGSALNQGGVATPSATGFEGWGLPAGNVALNQGSNIQQGSGFLASHSTELPVGGMASVLGLISGQTGDQSQPPSQELDALSQVVALQLLKRSSGSQNSQLKALKAQMLAELVKEEFGEGVAQSLTGVAQSGLASYGLGHDTYSQSSTGALQKQLLLQSNTGSLQSQAIAPTTTDTLYQQRMLQSSSGTYLPNVTTQGNANSLQSQRREGYAPLFPAAGNSAKGNVSAVGQEPKVQMPQSYSTAGQQQIPQSYTSRFSTTQGSQLKPEERVMQALNTTQKEELAKQLVTYVSRTGQSEVSDDTLAQLVQNAVAAQSGVGAASSAEAPTAKVANRPVAKTYSTPWSRHGPSNVSGVGSSGSLADQGLGAVPDSGPAPVPAPSVIDYRKCLYSWKGSESSTAASNTDTGADYKESLAGSVRNNDYSIKQATQAEIDWSYTQVPVSNQSSAQYQTTNYSYTQSSAGSDYTSKYDPTRPSNY